VSRTSRQQPPSERNRQAENALRYYSRLRRVRDHLLRCISEPLSAEGAARIADLSPNYFSTYFRQRVGMSFTHWAHGVRVQVALEMMRASDAPITEIAERVGYRDLRTFERAFKRHTSVTPRTFRVRVQPGGRRPAAGPRPDEVV
jgi:AraC-like DNA-binding protein